MAKITHTQLASMFRRLVTSYKAGIDIKTAYRRETEIGSTTYRVRSKLVLDEISNGKMVGEAMQAANGFFPDLAVSVVTAGEKGGRLEQAFERLASHYENLVKFRNNFLLSIAWPMFELAFAILVIGLLILILGYLVGDEAANWFGMGSAMANFLFYVGCVTGVLLSVGFLIVGVKNGWFGTLPMQIARRVPLVGKTIEALSLSRFAWTLSISENAGMSALEMTRMALNSTENYFYKRLVEPVRQSIQKGNPFSAAFRKTEAFPDDFLIYVENGETAGELAESMERASIDLQNRAEANLKLIGTIGFVCTFVLVAAVIGTVVITMAQKLYIDPINEMINL